MKPKKRKQPKFRDNKAAFDGVMKCYRDLSSCGGKNLSAMEYSGAGSGPSQPNQAKPTPQDYAIDVDRVIKKCLKDLTRRALFIKAYVDYDSEDSIDIEIHADKVMGPTRHGLEQGMGAEFLKRKLWPTQGRGGYFHTVRQDRGRK